ncbi:MAG: nicotinate phosphoribosyltransferase, partial [Myxococcales bacterium]
WKEGVHEREAVFHLNFRRSPFKGGYAVAAGLEEVLALLEGLRFDESDLDYLASLRGNDGGRLFEPGFLECLRGLRFSCDVDAVPEGTVVFPQEPLLRVKGPLLQAQFLETVLLNVINFQTLIATKAARVCSAARGEPVLEFGLRRAQGIDGALSAARASYIGGCAATSNVLAGKLYGIPVRGTHAHSWVMVFGDELESFRRYADAMPNNCLFLVDTYDTLQGVRHAVQVGQELKARGKRLVGIRLDSGDLAYLSIEARKILDEGGFPDAVIVGSNDLDEHLIASLKEQGATINVWGVGTRLVTAYDDAALGGVYKLSAIRDEGGRWQHRVKLSEQAVKISTPGILQVRRFRDEHGFVADMIFDEESGVPADATMVDPLDLTRRMKLLSSLTSSDLLVPVFRGGKRVYDAPPLEQCRARLQEQLSGFHAGVKRFVNPHAFPVGLESRLFDRKTQLVLDARKVPHVGKAAAG